MLLSLVLIILFLLLQSHQFRRLESIIGLNRSGIKLGWCFLQFNSVMMVLFWLHTLKMVIIFLLQWMYLLDKYCQHDLILKIMNSLILNIGDQCKLVLGLSPWVMSSPPLHRLQSYSNSIHYHSLVLQSG